MRRRDFLLLTGAAAALRPDRRRASWSGQTDQPFEDIAALVATKMADYKVPGVGLGIKPTPVFLKPGDVMRLTIQGLGEQKQKVVPYAA